MILLLLGPDSFVGGLAENLGFQIVFHEPAIIIAMVFVTFPFVIRGVQPLLEELDESEEEAAYTMGASKAEDVLSGYFSVDAARHYRAARCWPSPGRSPNSVRLCSWRAIFRAKRLIASVYIFGEIESDNPQGAAAVSVILLTLILSDSVGRQPRSDEEGGQMRRLWIALTYLVFLIC